MLMRSFAAIINRQWPIQLRCQHPLHLVVVPTTVELDHIGQEAVLGIPHVAQIAADVIQVRLRCQCLGSQQTIVIGDETFAFRCAFAADVIMVIGNIHRYL